MALAVLVLAPVGSQAALVLANGAGSLPSTSQNLTGIYVNEIRGNLSGTDFNDVNVFALNILLASDFSALTINAGPYQVPDTELYLFNSGGLGVYFNDDITVTNTLSCLPSSGTANPCPAPAAGLGPATAGTYFLAITRSFNGPLDLLGNEIFTNSSSTDVVRRNVGTGAVAKWDGNGAASPNFDSVAYDIVVTGATPEPATWTMMGSALVGLAGSRWAKRRSAAE